MIELVLDMDELTIIKDLVNTELTELTDLRFKTGDSSLDARRGQLQVLSNYLNAKIEEGDD